VSAARWPRVPLVTTCANGDDIKCGPFGTQLNKNEYRSEGVPLWGIKQVNAHFEIPTQEYLDTHTAKRLGQYDLQPNDIVMTRKGTVGNCAVYPAKFRPGIMHSDLLRIRVDPKRCDPSFLVHQLHSSADVARQLAIISGGAIMPGINVGRLKSLEVLLPALAEQRRIADVLDRAEALRAKRRAALDQLDDLTQAIFLELFGEPVTNVASWPTVHLQNLLTLPLRNGLSPSHSGTVEAKVLTLSAITGSMFDEDAWKLSTFQNATPSDQRVNSSDFLICRGNGNAQLVGKAYFPTRDMPDVTFPDTMIAARISDERIGRAFLQHIWHTAHIRRQIESLARTTNGTFKVNQSMLEGIAVLNPPLALQHEFARRVAVVEQLKSSYRASLSMLDELFASLQHQAFRGEV
jgi:type I restriction enzyme, S subunit